jgi:CubicO group peptidase (beta-lactamase class C family)
MISAKRLALVLIIASAVAIGLTAMQSEPAFDVASIKRNTSLNDYGGGGPRPGGRYRLSNATSVIVRNPRAAAQATSFADFERDLAEMREPFDIPGMTAAVAERGEIVWTRGFGISNPGRATSRCCARSELRGLWPRLQVA